MTELNIIGNIMLTLNLFLISKLYEKPTVKWAICQLAGRRFPHRLSSFWNFLFSFHHRRLPSSLRWRFFDKFSTHNSLDMGDSSASTWKSTWSMKSRRMFEDYWDKMTWFSHKMYLIFNAFFIIHFLSFIDLCIILTSQSFHLPY